MKEEDKNEKMGRRRKEGEGGKEGWSGKINKEVAVTVVSWWYYYVDEHAIQAQLQAEFRRERKRGREERERREKRGESHQCVKRRTGKFRQ